MQFITKEDAIRALREAVAERGEDYVYQLLDGGACLYVHNEAPSCGVGLALSKLGVPLSILKQMDDYGLGSSMDDASPVLHENGYALERGAYAAFREFQHTQDSGVKWGAALLFALVADELADDLDV